MAALAAMMERRRDLVMVVDKETEKGAVSPAVASEDVSPKRQTHATAVQPACVTTRYKSIRVCELLMDRSSATPGTEGRRNTTPAHAGDSNDGAAEKGHASRLSVTKKCVKRNFN